MLTGLLALPCLIPARLIIGSLESSIERALRLDVLLRMQEDGKFYLNYTRILYKWATLVEDVGKNDSIAEAKAAIKVLPTSRALGPFWKPSSGTVSYKLQIACQSLHSTSFRWIF